MSSIHSGTTSKGLGTWVQAGNGPTYLKVIIKGAARVKIVSSDTNGPGAGGETVDEDEVTHDDSFVYPAGPYYLNADVLEIGPDGEVHVEAVN